MNVAKLSFIGLAFICSGCVCMFLPCDRELHVSGHVFDTQHRPVGNATIKLYGVPKQADETGCFYFGGVLAASGFGVSVAKPGYKSYHEAKEFDFYDIDVTLASEDSNQASSGVWHKLPAADLVKYKECSEK